MPEGKITRFSTEAIFNEQYISAEESLDFLKNKDNFMTISKGLARELGNLGYAGEADELYRILRKKMKDQGVAPADATIKGWLFDNILPKRQLALKLCFALELSPEQAVQFLNRACFQNGFSLRSAEEIVYLYCLKYKKSFTHATALLQQLRDIDSVEADAELKGTKLIKEEQDKLPDDDRMLLLWLATRSINFTGQSQTAYDWYVSLKQAVVDAIRSSPGFSEIDKENPDSDTDYNDKEISYDKLLQYLYLDLDIVLRGKKRPEADFKSLKESGISDTLSGIPLPEQLKKIERKEIGVDREVLITLMFFSRFYNDYEEWEHPYDDFYADMNVCLDECGMGLLYPPNPFDWLILKCVNSLEADGEDPVVYFNEILGMSFGED